MSCTGSPLFLKHLHPQCPIVFKVKQELSVKNNYNTLIFSKSQYQSAHEMAIKVYIIQENSVCVGWGGASRSLEWRDRRQSRELPHFRRTMVCVWGPLLVLFSCLSHGHIPSSWRITSSSYKLNTKQVLPYQFSLPQASLISNYQYKIMNLLSPVQHL